MAIKKLKRAKFGNNKIWQEVSGYVLHQEGKGYLAFSCDRDKYGILIPYMPCGGRKALQSILDQGGFTTLEGMEFVQELGA